tara:strand:- start:2777 stop:3676 length:900 start_codon:yes stop_codon:yes gene_type:complete
MKFKYLIIILIILNACSEVSVKMNDEINNENIVGTGFFEFNEKLNKKLKVYYHNPTNSNENSTIIFIFHGGGRNAKDYRNAIIDKANHYNFIAIIPEFSDDNFSGGDGYNLGNVYIDGDNPSATTLNPEEEWAFSYVEPIFDFVKEKTKNINLKYNIIGHSAGSQFAHRFVMFTPNANFDKVVASAAGWYTVPNENISFPYGFKNSILENIDYSKLFSKAIYIQVGELDNNPNDGSLRRNTFADAQGINRFTRAYYFYNQSKEKAAQLNTIFNWKIETNVGLDHNFKPALNKASDLLFN